MLQSEESNEDGDSLQFVARTIFGIKKNSPQTTTAWLGLLFCVVLMLPVAPRLAAASNGLNLIGFGTESSSMGGADLAVARDTTALNTNPAGLMQITGSRIDVLSGFIFPLQVVHRDTVGNNQAVPRSPKLLGDLGYAHHFATLPVTVGLGLFAQAGAVADYPNLATAFGTRDSLASSFRVAKLTSGAALQATPPLSLGASLSLLYADLTQQFFPNTSFYNATDPSQSFFGFDLDAVSTTNIGVRLGAQYRVSDRATMGLAYSSRVALDMDGGPLVSDLTSLGLGKVTYRDVSVTGLNQPQEFGVGLALRLTEPLLVAVEINRIDWAGALKSSTLKASDPDNPSAPPVQEGTVPLNWKNQYVLAVGATYDTGKNVLLRAGYNYGRNPIPDEALNPFFAAIGQHHATFGVGYRLNVHWQLDGGVEYHFQEKATFTNSSLPFGPNAETTVEVLLAQFMISHKW